LHNPSFAAYARLCGGHGIPVKLPEQIGPALEEALGHDGPALVEIITDADLI
jgi:pyruvate oxidase